MTFALLGPLEVRIGERLLQLGGSKQRALLALLLLHANRTVAVERLVDGLWGEAPPDTAVKTVQVYVSRLRKLLPPATLVTQPPGYRLIVDPEDVDLLRFERLVAAGLMRDALALWRGTPLAEFAGEPFAQPERRRLEELRLTALEGRIGADLALGRHGEVVGELTALVAEHPRRERLRELLMLALYRAGRQAEALEAYRDARVALDEIGLEPSDALRALERRILVQDAGLAATARPPLPGPLLPEPRHPFVRREAELATFAAAVEAAASGRGSALLVAGEAGAGKTRLIREAATRAARDGVLVLYGAADAAVGAPYQPLRDWLEFLLRVLDPAELREALAAGGAPLARLVPAVAALLGAEASPAEGDRELLQSAAAGLLGRLSRVRPLLLVMDDLHWADAETLQLLKRLSRAAPEGAIVVVAAYRDAPEELREPAAGAVTDLARLEGVSCLRLGGLGRGGIHDFIRASAGADPPAVVTAAIDELTNGVPLYLCELWQELRETHGVEIVEGAVRLTRPLDDIGGAGRVGDVVRQRLARLGAETSALVELAAVAGPRFELVVVAAAAGADAATVIEPLERATRSGVVEQLPGPPATCRFTHELVRRAVYDGISPLRRSLLHLRVGEALEGLSGGDDARVLPDLAHHFAAAAPAAGPQRGVDYNVRAAKAAAAQAAFSDAVGNLRTALELGVEDPGERALLQVELSYLLEQTGHAPEATASLEAAFDTATALQERRVAAYAVVHRTRSVTMQDPEVDPAAMQKLAEQALATFEELGDLRGLALAGRSLALTLRRGGRMGAATETLEQALQHAVAAGDRETQQQVVGSLVYLLCEGPAHVPGAIARCRQLRALDAHDPTYVAIVERALACLLAMAGEAEEARELLERSTAVLDRLDNATVVWVFRTMSAEARLYLGDAAGARAEQRAKWLHYLEPASRARDELFNRVADHNGMRAAYALALLYEDDGAWEEAERCLEHGSAVPVPPYFLEEAVLGLAARARLAAHRGEDARAEELAEHAVAMATTSDALNLTATAWRALGAVAREEARAATAIASALAAYEAKGNLAAAAAVRNGRGGAAARRPPPVRLGQPGDE